MMWSYMKTLLSVSTRVRILADPGFPIGPMGCMQMTYIVGILGPGSDKNIQFVLTVDWVSSSSAGGSRVTILV